jgi:hypothetical protein
MGLATGVEKAAEKAAGGWLPLLWSWHYGRQVTVRRAADSHVASLIAAPPPPPLLTDGDGVEERHARDAWPWGGVGLKRGLWACGGHQNNLRLQRYSHSIHAPARSPRKHANAVGKSSHSMWRTAGSE